ncbi:MAG: hypothetical protein AB1491_11640 [Thermodesulfobacteriota bacterium]
MAEIIDLEGFRRKLAANKGFRTWLARFKEQFGPETLLKDLSPQTLLFLATPGEDNLYVYFDLIMAVQGLGGSARFRLDDLDSATKLRIMDNAFALLDRVRFEVMRRLGWAEAVPGEETPLISLVQQAWVQGAAFTRELPRLSSGHPEYSAYHRLSPMDQGVFLRRLIPQAVVQFRKQVETGER